MDLRDDYQHHSVVREQVSLPGGRNKFLPFSANRAKGKGKGKRKTKSKRKEKYLCMI
jgi:hypothetical protein